MRHIIVRKHARYGETEVQFLRRIIDEMNKAFVEALVAEANTAATAITGLKSDNATQAAQIVTLTQQVSDLEAQSAPDPAADDAVQAATAALQNALNPSAPAA